MPRIYIDFTEDETAWCGGEIGVTMIDRDTMRGNDPAILVGDHEMILSVRQAITLFDLLDGWLNGVPAMERGGIERRISEALKDAAEDFTPAVKGAISRSREELAKTLYAYFKMKGLRFRLSGEDPEENPSLVRRYEKFRQRQRDIVERRNSSQSELG